MDASLHMRLNPLISNIVPCL